MERSSGSEKGALGELVTEARTQGTILGGFAALLWVIQIVNAVIFDGGLARLGIHPRTLSGLSGIFFAPFIHASFAHLIANTVPLLVLGWFVMLRRKRDLFTVSALAALVGGLGTWLIAPALSVHVGASILIFGYLGYLLFRGIFERRFWPIVGSALVFLLYGGALTGVLPGEVGISWQGHLFGFLGGILAARLLRGTAPTAPSVAPIRRRISGIADALPGAALRNRIASPTSAPTDEDPEIEAELQRVKRQSLR